MNKRSAINMAKNLNKMYKDKTYVVIELGAGYCALPTTCLKGEEKVIWSNQREALRGICRLNTE